MRRLKFTDKRETQDLFINGYIYTLIKGRKDQMKSEHTPCFCGKKGWALKEIIKMKRTR